MDPDSSRISVTVTDGRGRRVRDGGLGRWLTSVAPARARGDIAVALAPDAQVRALNRRYRRKDSTTDVLAFAALQTDGRTPRTAPRFLGDIVIAKGVARRQARAMGHAYHVELRVLALHGLLHLLGYDHEADGDGGRMSRVEARLRRKGGLENGLIGRNRLGRSERKPSGVASAKARAAGAGGGAPARATKWGPASTK